MENELYQYLTTLSNKELVKILEEPGEYTREAITVVGDLLESRRISGAETDAIRRDLLEEVFEAHKRKQRLETKWGPFITVYELIKKPSLIKEDKYLLLSLLSLLLLYYLAFLPRRLSFLYFEITHIQWVGFFFAAVNFIQLLSTPVVMQLLHRRRRLGWMLAAGGKTIEEVYTVCSWLGYRGHYSYIGTITRISIILHLLLLTGILVCLFYRRTIHLFGVSRSLQAQILFAGAAIGILYYFILVKLYLL